MARATEKQIAEIAAAYIKENKIAIDTFNVTKDNLINCIDKIGKMVTLDTSFIDPLYEMDGDFLPYGKTVEEYYWDLILPMDYDPTGAGALKPYDSTARKASYSYTLGRKKIPLTIRNNNIERAVNNPEQYAQITAQQVKRQQDSKALFKFGAKKNVLATAITKIESAMNPDKTFTASTKYDNGSYVKKDANTPAVVMQDIPASNTQTFDQLVTAGTLVKLTMITKIAKPVDTATSEAFIKAIKQDVETAKFATEGNSLNGNSIGAAAEGLILYIKKGIMPTIEVDALAGAFHQENLAFPVTIKVLDDFGAYTGDAFAVLADGRSMMLHPTYEASRENMNGDGDFLNIIMHTENTAFISRDTFFKVYKP